MLYSTELHLIRHLGNRAQDKGAILGFMAQLATEAGLPELPFAWSLFARRWAQLNPGRPLGQRAWSDLDSSLSWPETPQAVQGSEGDKHLARGLARYARANYEIAWYNDAFSCAMCRREPRFCFGVEARKTLAVHLIVVPEPSETQTVEEFLRLYHWTNLFLAHRDGCEPARPAGLADPRIQSLDGQARQASLSRLRPE